MGTRAVRFAVREPVSGMPSCDDYSQQAQWRGEVGDRLVSWNAVLYFVSEDWYEPPLGFCRTWPAYRRESRVRLVRSRVAVSQHACNSEPYCHDAGYGMHFNAVRVSPTIGCRFISGAVRYAAWIRVLAGERYDITRDAV